MVGAGFSSFDTMVGKANRHLKDVECGLRWPKERRKQSYAALRAVLYPLRDRLPVETAVQFGAQLPTIVRGVYYDGWKPVEPLCVFDRVVFQLVDQVVAAGEVAVSQDPAGQGGEEQLGLIGPGGVWWGPVDVPAWVRGQPCTTAPSGGPR